MHFLRKGERVAGCFQEDNSADISSKIDTWKQLVANPRDIAELMAVLKTFISMRNGFSTSGAFQCGIIIIVFKKAEEW